MTTNLSFRIYKNIDLVYEYLTNLEKFASVHPVISKIDKVSDENYLVHETLKFIFIPFSFTYPVSIERKIAERKIIFLATVFKMISIEMNFILTADNDYTNIEEVINFKTILPIRSILEYTFKKQHKQLFINIERM